MTKRKLLEWGGVAAGVVLIAFGIGTLVLSIAGHNEVRTQLERETIVGSPDMTPEEIAKGAQEAGLPDSIELPTCSVAGEPSRHRIRGEVLCGLHADPRAREHRRPELCRDGPVRVGCRPERSRPGRTTPRLRRRMPTATRSPTAPATSG